MIHLTFHLVLLHGILIALIGLGLLEENMNPLSFGLQPVNTAITWRPQVKNMVLDVCFILKGEILTSNQL